MRNSRLQGALLTRRPLGFKGGQRSLAIVLRVLLSAYCCWAHFLMRLLDYKVPECVKMFSVCTGVEL
jgi:hypothetical protein